MLIRWHGHSCFEFSNGDTTIVVDPHDGRSIGLKPPSASANVVLMSHDHYDHNACRVIKGEHQDLKSFVGETVVNGGITVYGYPSWHDHSNGSERGPNTIYKFTMDNISVCHCGDLGCIPSDDVISQIKGVDFLFVPVGEVYTMEHPELKKFLELVNPRIIVPMHYMVGGLSFRLSALDKFLDMIPDNAVDFVGNELDISQSDLPMVKECWVFDH
jgi:L-ascorbate metabolism protein UlaG (beta-lactamase superfamily)